MIERLTFYHFLASLPCRRYTFPSLVHNFDWFLKDEDERRSSIPSHAMQYVLVFGSLQHLLYRYFFGCFAYTQNFHWKCNMMGNSTLAHLHWWSVLQQSCIHSRFILSKASESLKKFPHNTINLVNGPLITTIRCNTLHVGEKKILENEVTP